MMNKITISAKVYRKNNSVEVFKFKFMKYKLLGNTGLKVSELCLGTMTFGGQGTWTAIGALPLEDVKRLIKISVDAGVNFIDTANIYSFGLSEQLTGSAIRELGLRRYDLVIATKVRGMMGEGPNDVGLSRKHIMQQIEDSLQRLQTDYIDLYQIHGFDSQTPMEETLETLDMLVKSGKVRYIGCSNLAAWQIMKALGISAQQHLSKFVSLQAYYTLAGRDIEREIVPLLLDQKMGLLVWSPHRCHADYCSKQAGVGGSDCLGMVAPSTGGNVCDCGFKKAGTIEG